MEGKRIVSQGGRACRVALLSIMFLIASLVTASAANPGDNYPSVTLWPLAYHYEDVERSRTDIFWPLYHQTRKGTHTRTAVRPFIFNYETDPARDFRQTNLFWPLTHFEYEKKTFKNWVFPFYFHAADEQQSTLMVWPFYGHSSKADGSRSWSTLYPFFQYRKKGAPDFWQADYLWPLGRSYREGESSGSYFLPLWWRQNGPESSGGYFFPYFWLNRAEMSLKALLPIWWSQSGPDASGGYLFPYFWLNLGETQQKALIPFWWQKKSPDSSLGYLFPYFWRTTESSRQKGLFPLWYSSRQETAQTDYLLPWFSHQNETATFRTLFPLYWKWAQQEGNHFSLIPGLYWSSQFNHHRLKIAFPFYFRHDNLRYDTTLRYYFPFYGDYRTGAQIRNRYFLFPLYLRIDDPTIQRRAWYFLWPLIYSETTPESRESWFVPFYWSSRGEETDVTMALALYWNFSNPEYRLRLLAPFYLHTRFPSLETRHYFPFYSDIRKADGYRMRFYLGPLAFRTDAPAQNRKQLDILWPLISKKQQGETRHFRLLPFYWQDKKPDESLTLAALAFLPPYYVHHAELQSSRFHIWPFYGHEQDASYEERSVAWPLFRWGSNPEGTRKSWQAILAYSTRTPDNFKWGFFPLWAYEKSPRGTRNISLLHWQESWTNGGSQFSLLHLADPDTSLFTIRNKPDGMHHHLFPLYGYSRNYEKDSTYLLLLGPLYIYERRGEERLKNMLLWKLLYYERVQDRREAGFLWRLIRSKKDTKGSLFEFNPFYYSESRKDGEAFSSWLGGLYSVRTGKDSSRHRLFWFITWSSGGSPDPG